MRLAWLAVFYKLSTESSILKSPPKLELDCIIHSMKFSKEDFVIGHLDFIVKKFHVMVERYVDNRQFYDYIKRVKPSKRIKTEVHKINLRFIDELLALSSLILYIDAYHLFKAYHYPHFITVLDKKGKIYKIFDTWEGKERGIDTRTLSKSISSLRNHIRLCPQVIRIYKE